MRDAEKRISLATSVLQAAREAGSTFGTVESCTGGLIAAAFTEIPGSADVLMGGLVTYDNRIKREMANVPQALLDAHGAVSEQVARAMAEGGRARLQVDWCVASTGIAGPSGGSEEKPVGLVHIAVAGPHGTQHQELRLDGDRAAVRAATVTAALTLLQRSMKA